MSELDVAAANLTFYAAFTGTDRGSMDAIWAREHPVFCIHPGWPPLLSRASVISSWYKIFDGPAPPMVRFEQPVVHVVGDLGYVVGREVISGNQLAATNIFVRESTGWKICHHQATPIASEMLAADLVPPTEMN